MTKYVVHLMTTVEHHVEVEAESGDEAVANALVSDSLPYAPGFADYEFGEWTTASELFPDHSKPEHVTFHDIADSIGDIW